MLKAFARFRHCTSLSKYRGPRGSSSGRGHARGAHAACSSPAGAALVLGSGAGATALLLGSGGRERGWCCSCAEDPGAASSWTRGLLALGGWWSDAAWYDLQMERRLPETAALLRETIWALPPLSGKRVADIAAGTGRSALAMAEAYPLAELTLLEVDEERGRLAMARLQQQAAGLAQPGMPEARFLHCAVVADGSQLAGGTYDCVVAVQAVRHIVAPAPHYALKHGLPALKTEHEIAEGYSRMLRSVYDSLAPGGHFFIADHQVPNHPGVFAHCQLLKEAGFDDVDVAWRQRDWFVVGARRPLAS